MMTTTMQPTKRASWAFPKAVACAVFTAAVGLGSPVFAQPRPPVDLLEMSLEELLTLEITSAGKKSQLIGETAAAIYVITADDIRRSHATTLMDLLRQVPGILVARESTGSWSISIRGFAHENANKLLVLIDGRTLYTPVFTGVEWKGQDTLLEDIDRIEVVRGPGGSVWGANAVNGVINIITKSASDTQGTSLSLQTGTRDNGTLSARYGGSLGDTAHFRVFAKYFNRPSLPNGEGVTDWGGWNSLRQGGRVDWAPTGRDRVTASSEWFVNNVFELDDEMTPETFPLRAVVEERDRLRAGFLLGRWTRTRASGSEFDLQIFHDRNRAYDASGRDRAETVRTTDAEFRYHMNLEGAHDVVWGGGFRQVDDRVDPALDSWFEPAEFTARTFNAFLQDEMTWRQDTLRFTAGTKVEWNSFSGAEVQPTARLLWAVNSRHSVWTAASRAVRVPSRFELDRYSIEDVEEEDDAIVYDLFIPPQSFKPEAVLGYEAGYRFLPGRSVSLDVSTFYNKYTNLESIERGEQQVSTVPIGGLMTPLIVTNAGFGKVYGAEVLAFWTITNALQLSGSYSRLHMRMDDLGMRHNEKVDRWELNYAKNIFFVRAYAELPYGVELNGDLRFVDAVPGQEVDSYLDGNVNVSRELRRGLRLNISVENALQHHHAEWDEGDQVLPRAIRAGFSWQF
jgi:iron complex outermembrane receptor protein